MAKPNPAAKAATPAAPESGRVLVVGEFVGKTPAHMPVETPLIDPAALNAQPDPQAPPAEELVSARVLCAVTIGANSYQPDEVIEGLPATIAAQHVGAIDSHPDAVAYAMDNGPGARQYTPE